MTSSLSNLANNLAERIHKTNVNTGIEIKNAKFAELNAKIASVVLNIQMLKII